MASAHQKLAKRSACARERAFLTAGETASSFWGFLGERDSLLAFLCLLLSTVLIWLTDGIRFWSLVLFARALMMLKFDLHVSLMPPSPLLYFVCPKHCVCLCVFVCR